MSEHHRAVAPIVGSFIPRRRRWLIGTVGALGAGGLILGVGVPVSAGEVNAAGNVHASAGVQGGCVTVAVGTGEADGSVQQPATDADPLQAAGQGAAMVSVCRDDPGDPPPGDPGSVPGDLDDVVPGDLDGVPLDDLGGSLIGELLDATTGVLEGGPPGDGDGSLPPGDPAGGLPGGNDGGGPAVNPSANGPASGSVSVGGAGAERGTPTDGVLGPELGNGAPASVATGVSHGATLPRTGGGLGNGVLRLVAVLGLGRAVLGLAHRRRPAADAARG